MADIFKGNSTWCTKDGWENWHFYCTNIVMPLCGRLDVSLLRTDGDILVAKSHPDTGACERCQRQGIRAGLWEV